MGHSINPHGDENDFPAPPPSMEWANTDANDPQMQCQLAKALGEGYMSMPVPCQLAALDEMPSPERDKKHAITTKGQDSPLPLPAIPTTPTFYNLVYAKRATFKTTSAQREDDPQPDGCTYSNDGNPNCNVSVTDNTVPGFVEANDGSPENFKGLTNRQKLNFVIESVRERLTDPDCSKLVNNFDASTYLLKNVNIGTQSASGKSFSSDLEAARTTSEYSPKGKRSAGGQTVFNENSFFFTDKAQGVDVEKFLSPKIRQAIGIGDLPISELLELIVIHELVHVGDTDGNFDDLDKTTGKGTPNPSLNKKILNSCFKNRGGKSMASNES